MPQEPTAESPPRECTELIGLHPAARFAGEPDGRLIVSSPWGLRSVRGLPDRIRAKLADLVVSPRETSEVLADEDLAAFLTRFRWLIVRTLVIDGDAMVKLEPLGVDAVPGDVSQEFKQDSPLRLSRFAFCRAHRDWWILESPLCLYRAELSPALAGLLAELATTRTARELAKTTAGQQLSESAVHAVLGELVNAGFVQAGDDGFAEDTDPSLRTWAFHDLLFHTRSRSGRHDYPVGMTFPYLDEIPPLPAVKPPTRADLPVHRLVAPDLDAVAEADRSFTDVLESRRSHRRYGDDGLTVGELGEFLYRALRVRARYPRSVQTPYEASSRPYPSGGATYDLEVYLAVNRCRGLGQGIYHYDPEAHTLLRLHGTGSELAALGGKPHSFDSEPDVMLVITSRFRRLSWKYSSIAYATTLRNVGALYQTLYLVATAMGLAACGLGVGDIAVAEKSLGENFTDESTVGEFALGSRSPRRSA